MTSNHFKPVGKPEANPSPNDPQRQQPTEEPAKPFGVVSGQKLNIRWSPGICSTQKSPIAFGWTSLPDSTGWQLIQSRSANSAHAESTWQEPLSGTFLISENYHGCARCGNNATVACNRCGSISCHATGAGAFSCPSCQNHGTIQGEMNQANLTDQA